jgi:hypothetical protein
MRVAVGHALYFVHPRAASLVENSIAKVSLHILRTFFALDGNQSLA